MLGKLLRGMLCHVNVIPLNPTNKFGGKPTAKIGVLRFIEVLAEYGVTATPRTRRGIDIDAGCGQLKADLMRKKKLLAVEEVEAKSTDPSLDAGDDDGSGSILLKEGRRRNDRDVSRDDIDVGPVTLKISSSKDQRSKDIEVLLKSMD